MNLTGSIRQGVPYLFAEATHQGELAFRAAKPASKDRTLALVVDTGFEGMLALPESLINRLDFDYVGQEDFRMADNQIRPLPVYLIPVIVGKKRGLGHVIAAQALLGMEFISTWGSRLELDVMNKKVKLILRT